MAWTEIRSLLNRSWVHCLSLVILLTAFTHFEPLQTAVLDADIWWHLRGGDAIVSQHTFPDHAVFTQHPERPWIEYSWGFEVILSRLYHWFGLMGIVGLRVGFEVLIAAILFVILRRGLGTFWYAWLVTAVGIWILHHCLGTRPMLFSIAIFALEVGIILDSLRRVRIGLLWLLPPLFVLWANLHIQFVYGIMVLGLLALTTVVQSVLPARLSEWFQHSRLPAGQVVAVLGLSMLATLIGPYSWHLYSVILGYAGSTVPYSIITELQALDFRSPSHYALVLVVAGAFFALGWRRSRDPFKLFLLVLCTMIGFRMNRDSWVACIPALAVIADRRGSLVLPGIGVRPRMLSFAGATALATIAVLALVVWDTKTNNQLLTEAVALNFPTKACAFIRSSSLPGPLYNDANWGGYLIWELPEKPVAIDNRTDLYGDNLMNEAYRVQRGFADWKTDPDLNAAHVILLSRFLQLGRLLFQDKQHFRLVYQDNLALVFTRNDTSLQASEKYRTAVP